MGMPDIPDHTQEKLHDQIAVSMDILLYAKSKLSTSKVFEILKLKLSNPIGLEYFQLQFKN